MKRNLIPFALIVFLFSSMSACENGPGEGGTSTIKGKIFIQNYNGSGNLVSEYYAPEERVYIIYGDADFYGNDTRTSYDGTYEFQYLRKGSYTVFAYSDCDTCASGTEAIKAMTEITDNHSTVELPDIILKR
ncbi:MAG: hypothetical protein K1X63_16875 [Chitinophagales bacterium]|nr:hypothetical protein [Bacteroidota bacterium]MBX7142750.1 hypothetical protein [Chitinophagales bacterium]